jgi:hypothetical protein
MPYYDRRCTACSALRIDNWEPTEAPAVGCLECGAPTERVWIGKPAAVKSDEWAGGKTFENGFDKPRTFYSPSEYHKALAERGLKVRGDGEEGKWGWMSRDTLEKAKELVTRCSS